MTRIVLATSIAAGLLLAGCAGTAGTSDPSPAPSRDTAVLEEAAALLPDDIATSGALVVGTSPGPVPFTYRAGDDQVTGADLDLTRELAERLGLQMQVETTDFEGVITGVAGGTFDVGASGIFNTEPRREVVDFVDYLRGGTQWAVPAGSKIDPARACGLRVLAITGSVQAKVDVPERSRSCTRKADPPLSLTEVTSSDEASVLLLRGEADAFIADAPVVAHLVGMSKGRIVTAGAAYDPQTYGLVVSRDSPGLREALNMALASMIRDGTYARIMGKWGLEDGTISLG
jgi:polar amino acid transport system substrate-binding protein